MNRVIAFVTSVFVILGQLSCGTRKSDEELLAPLQHADTLFAKDKAAGRAYLDSICEAEPEAAPYVMYRRMLQRYRWTFFSEGRVNYPLIDSMIDYMAEHKLDKSYTTEYVALLNSKADNFFETEQLAKAFDLYSLGLLKAKENGQIPVSNELYHLGMISYRQERYPEAVRFFKEALADSNAIPYSKYSVFRIAELYGNIGLSETRLQQWDSAIKHYRLSIEYAQRNAPAIDEATFAEKTAGVAMGNIAKVFAARGEIDSAERYLLKSIALNDREGYDKWDAMYGYMQLAELYNKTGKVAQALPCLDSMEKRLAVMPNRDLKARWLFVKHLVSEGLKATTAGHSYADQYLSLRDSIDDEHKKLKQVDYGQVIKVKEAEYQITLLQKTNQISRIYLALAISSIVIVLGIILIVYRNYKRTKQNLAELKRLNDEVNLQKQRLEIAMEMLQESNNDKDRILHIVAHDLRSPVGAVISILDFIKLEEDEQEKQNMLELMGTASVGALELINEILEFSQSAKEKNASPPARVDVNAVAYNAVKLLQFRATEKAQKLVLTIHTEPMWVLAHAEKLIRLLSNLIINAIKFSAVNTEINIVTTLKGGKAITTVADKGMGIRDADKPHIFETFTNARKKGTSGERSYGLGLSICRQIAEAYGGRIWFESEEGKGSTFYVELPLA